MIGTKPLVIPNKELQDKVDPKYRRDMETIERYINGLEIVFPPPPAASIWESVPISIAAANWDTADAKGVWDFSVPGQISQTQAAPDASADDYIYYNTDEWGLSWALEADITIPAVTPATVGNCFGMVGAGFDLNAFQAGALLSQNATQFMQGISQVAGEFYISAQTNQTVAGVGGATLLALGSTHTIRGLFFDTNYIGWLDGSDLAHIDAKYYAFTSFDSPTVDSIPHTSRFMLTAFNQYGGGNGGFPVTFANLKAWRVPIPTLP